MALPKWKYTQRVGVNIPCFEIDGLYYYTCALCNGTGLLYQALIHSEGCFIDDECLGDPFCPVQYAQECEFCQDGVVGPFDFGYRFVYIRYEIANFDITTASPAEKQQLKNKTKCAARFLQANRYPLFPRKTRFKPQVGMLPNWRILEARLGATSVDEADRMLLDALSLVDIELKLQTRQITRNNIYVDSAERVQKLGLLDSWPPDYQNLINVSTSPSLEKAIVDAGYEKYLLALN